MNDERQPGVRTMVDIKILQRLPDKTAVSCHERFCGISALVFPVKVRFGRTQVIYLDMTGNTANTP
ncbi:hypothetical protein [Jeongeupia chitinilytica]|uniref:hypothetical protein n=1 Tax=Jeongeupia chitinilytica TaxID=1041641 RepID=UPI001675F731|nr:hypothetical protein [Jeongeupia chitinilytica]